MNRDQAISGLKGIADWNYGKYEQTKEEDYQLDGDFLTEVIEFLNIFTVDAASIVRCAYCKHCFDTGSDPIEPYDGESEWHCDYWDVENNAYEHDPYRFFCAYGERRGDDGTSDRC